MFFKRRTDGSPYWVTVCFKLKEPLVVQGDPRTSTSSTGVAVGFYQNFGITATSAAAALAAAVAEVSKVPPEATLVSDETTSRPVDVATLSAIVRKHSSDWRKDVVWYRSGRIFVEPEAEEPQG